MFQPVYPTLSKHGFAIGILLLVTLVASFGSGLEMLLKFDHRAIMQGQVWRLFTCHFVHFNGSHLALNMAGLLLIWWLFGQVLNWREWLIVLLPSCLVVSLGILVLRPDIATYVGFSGVLHSIIVVAALFDLPSKHRDGKILLAAICVKLLYEQLFGPLPGSEASTGGKVLVDAHLYGAVAGLAISPILWQLRQRLSI